MISKIVDSSLNEILPTEEKDDTYLCIERMAGASMEVRQRIMMNFFVKKDELFSFLKND